MAIFFIHSGLIDNVAPKGVSSAQRNGFAPIELEQNISLMIGDEI